MQDQINGVLQRKNRTPEEKFDLLVMEALNPFMEPNFSDRQLQSNVDERFKDEKYPELIDPTEHKSVLQLMREGTDFLPEHRKEIDTLITELRGAFDIPFDELYHKEKALVMAVVEAEQALKDKMATLKSALTDTQLSNQELLALTQKSIISDEYMPISRAKTLQ